MIRFRENGLLLLWTKPTTVFGTISKINLKESDITEPIKIEQMTQVLSIPLIGILLGTTVITIEFIRKRRCLQKY